MKTASITARQALLLISATLLVLAAGHLAFHYCLFSEQVARLMFF
jgi:hypothetical protein